MLINSLLYYSIVSACVVITVKSFYEVFSSERSNKMLNVLTRTTNTYTTSIMKKDQEIEKLREYSNFLKMKNDEYKSQLTSMTNEKTPTVAGDYSAH